MAIDKTPLTPENLNLSAPNKWKLAIRIFPNTEFFCTEVNLPGVRIPPIEVHDPNNRLSVAGKKLLYDEFTVRFRISEDYENWREIYTWMNGIAAPQSYSQFKTLVENNDSLSALKYRIYTDATLISLTNVGNKNKEIVFRDLWPV